MQSRPIQKYIQRAAAGVGVGRATQAAYQRHLRDLDTYRAADSPYYFDPKQAKAALEFISYLVHVDGAKTGDRLTLDPWQQALVWMLFGWRRRSDGKRRFTRAYISVARKNGKTTLVAALALYSWLAEGEKGAQGFCCATKRDQAKLSWNIIAEQIRSNPYLKNKITVNTAALVLNTSPMHQFKPLGGIAKKEDGSNPHIVIVDEFHAWETRDLLDVMASGMGTRPCPLLIIITTAGTNIYSPCYAEQEHAIRVAEGAIDQPDYLGVVYTLDAEDEWTDPKVWVKANPGINTIHQPGFIAKRVQEAITRPSLQPEMKTKHLNIWVESAATWIEHEKWDAIFHATSWEAMRGRECVVGIDISSTRDLTAVCYCFLPTADDPKYHLKWKHWVPGVSLLKREQLDRVPYTLWRSQGWLYPTMSDAVNIEEVITEIRSDIVQYSILEIGYDPRYASRMVEALEYELEMVPVAQSPKFMNPLLHELETAVLQQEVYHDGNPLARWQLTCVELKENHAGDMVLVNPHTRMHHGKRIDAIVAAILAYGRAKLGGRDNTISAADVMRAWLGKEKENTT